MKPHIELRRIQEKNYIHKKEEDYDNHIIAAPLIRQADLEPSMDRRGVPVLGGHEGARNLLARRPGTRLPALP